SGRSFGRRAGPPHPRITPTGWRRRVASTARRRGGADGPVPTRNRHPRRHLLTGWGTARKPPGYRWTASHRARRPAPPGAPQVAGRRPADGRGCRLKFLRAGAEPALLSLFTAFEKFK